MHTSQGVFYVEKEKFFLANCGTFIPSLTFIQSPILLHASIFFFGYHPTKEGQNQITTIYTHRWGCNSVVSYIDDFYSYTGVPSDLNRLIRFPPLPELPVKCESVSTDLFSGSLRLCAALVTKRTTTRKAKIPVVTPYINISSAIRLVG